MRAGPVRYARAVQSTLTIAHVLGSFGMGGAERVALDLAAAQLTAGHQVLVISLDGGPEGPLGPLFRDAGIAVHTLPKRPGIDATLPPRAAALFARERVDIVHTHNPPPLIYTAAAARALGTPVVHTKHGEGHMGSRGEKLLRRLAAPCAQVFAAVSEETAIQAQEQRDCPPERLTVVPNGIALGRFTPDPGLRRDVRNELHIPADAWVVGTVGRIDENKNQRLLVAAMAPLIRADRDLYLVLVGDGPAMSALRQAVSELEPSIAARIQLLGRRTDAARIYNALDVFALPSLSEGLPLVIPEAMASALPVISTAVGGIPDVVLAGHTGYLVPAGDIDAMRSRLAELAADRDQARILGNAGRVRALAQYSAERMHRDYLGLYQRALAGAGLPTRLLRRARGLR